MEGITFHTQFDSQIQMRDVTFVVEITLIDLLLLSYHLEHNYHSYQTNHPFQLQSNFHRV